MTRKILIQGILSGVAIPVVCIATYMIASRNAAVDVSSLTPPASATASPEATPEPTTPEPTTGGGGAVVVPPVVVPPPATQPAVVPVPVPVVATSAPTVDVPPPTTNVQHTPTAPRTTSPAPVPVPPPVTGPLVSKYGKAHLVYTYQSAQGPRPTSCSGWVPKITVTDLYGTARIASITKSVLSFPDGTTSQLVTRFACDFSFTGKVPSGLDYTVDALVPIRPDVLVMMAPHDPVVFRGTTADPQVYLNVLLAFTG